jgi:hypothetical protein
LEYVTLNWTKERLAGIAISNNIGITIFRCVHSSQILLSTVEQNNESSVGVTGDGISNWNISGEGEGVGEGGGSNEQGNANKSGVSSNPEDQQVRERELDFICFVLFSVFRVLNSSETKSAVLF